MQTIRSVLELPRVNNQFIWKVIVTMMSPSQNPAKWKDFIAYTVNQNGNNITHTYTPRACISIQLNDQGKMKDTNYNDRWIMLDGKSIFRLKEAFQKFYEGFQIPELYFYDNDVLKLNQELSKEKTVEVLTSNKTLKISYAIIKGEESGSSDFEGIVIFINNYSIYFTLTYFELGYMISELEKIDLTTLSLQMIQHLNST